MAQQDPIRELLSLGIFLTVMGAKIPTHLWLKLLVQDEVKAVAGFVREFYFRSGALEQMQAALQVLLKRIPKPVS